MPKIRVRLFLCGMCVQKQHHLRLWSHDTSRVCSQRFPVSSSWKCGGETSTGVSLRLSTFLFIYIVYLFNYCTWEEVRRRNWSGLGRRRPAQFRTNILILSKWWTRPRLHQLVVRNIKIFRFLKQKISFLSAATKLYLKLRELLSPLIHRGGKS